MKRVFAGFTFLIALLFPIGAQLLASGGLSRVAFRHLSPLVVYLVFMATTFLVSAAITAWFFKSARIWDRISDPVPGARTMTVGVVLYVVYVLVDRFYSGELSGSSYVFQLLSFGAWPARLVLVFGATQFLLAVEPSNMPLQPIARTGRAPAERRR
jgi:hypothetical protein